MVGERCIYFDKSTSTYAEARKRCAFTFDGKGKVYEPRNFEESTKIAAEGKRKFNYPNWWLGVNDINEEGKLVFDSDGAPVPFTPTWNGGNGQTNDCVLILGQAIGPLWDFCAHMSIIVEL